jgi:hypothetical protein
MVGTRLVLAVVVVMVVIVVIVAVLVVTVAEEELVVVLAGGTAAMARVTETVMVILVPVTSMHFTMRWRSVVRRLHGKRTKLIWVNRPQVW